MKKCAAYCKCQCNRVGCECWDGITMVRFNREIQKVKIENSK